MPLPSHADAPDADIEADICVVGAGPAGIAFAREWIGTSSRIAILESGAVERDAGARTQSLSDAVMRSRHHVRSAPRRGRHRQVGGTANLWGYTTEPDDGRRYARALPPEALDLSSWPVGLEQLTPYYVRAQHLWNGGPFDYEVASWQADAPHALASEDGVLETRISQHGPREAFTQVYRDELLAADNVTLLADCTALELEANGDGRAVRSVLAARPDGSTFRVTAKVVVLACGGIENAQLLLLSSIARPGGPANRFDNVGRHLTDHPEFRLGTIAPTRSDAVDRIGLYDIRRVGGVLVSGFLTLREATKRELGLLNVSIALVPQPAGFGSRAHIAVNNLRSVRRGELPAGGLGNVGTLLKSPRNLGALLRAKGGYHESMGGWSRAEVDRDRFHAIEVHAATEQSSDGENLVTLGGGRDHLNRRRAAVHWRWSREDRTNVEQSLGLIAAELEFLGLGRFTRFTTLEGPSRPAYRGIHHPMSSTRMARDPRDGVVDPDCLVHGTTNLYVAGSSVFATGHGYANPTLTILALGVRLADHIKGVLGQR